MARTSGKMMILLAAAATLAAGLPAAGASTTAQAARLTSRATVFPGSLNGVSAASGTEAWATGTQCIPSCGHPGTLTLHWDGTTWSKVPSPDPGPEGTELIGAAAVSASDAWAVGDYGDSACGEAVTVILHWNGTAWSRVKSPDPGAACNWLTSVSALSSTDAWAVGESCAVAVNTCQTLILHWNGTTWSQAPSPTPGSGGFAPLTGVSADSAADAWAVGTYCTTKSCAVTKSLILHWNGTTWSKVTSPNPGTGTYSPVRVSADSPADAWVVGNYCTKSSCGICGTCGGFDTLILHWNGTTWSKVASPNPGPVFDFLNGVTALSPADAWAVGDYCTPKFCTGRNTLILHWNGTAWSQVNSPDPGLVNYLSAVDGTASGNAWAVGSTCRPTCGAAADALILRWNGTTWSTVAG